MIKTVLAIDKRLVTFMKLMKQDYPQKFIDDHCTVYDRDDYIVIEAGTYDSYTIPHYYQDFMSWIQDLQFVDEAQDDGTRYGCLEINDINDDPWAEFGYPNDFGLVREYYIGF